MADGNRLYLYIVSAIVMRMLIELVTIVKWSKTTIKFWWATQWSSNPDPGEITFRYQYLKLVNFGVSSMTMLFLVSSPTNHKFLTIAHHYYNTIIKSYFIMFLTYPCVVLWILAERINKIPMYYTTLLCRTYIRGSTLNIRIYFLYWKLYSFAHTYKF